MTQRENLLSLLRKQGYEWIPAEFSLCPSLVEEYRKHHGASGKDYQTHFGMPWRIIAPPRADQDCEGGEGTARFFPYHGAKAEKIVIDQWGVGHESTASSMHMSKMHHPLADAEDAEEILAYPMPKYSEENNRDLPEKIKRIHDAGFASCAKMGMTLWEISWYIRGMENLMMDMAADEELAEAMFEKSFEMSLQRAKLYANAGTDILFIGDDIGMQSSIMMSEEMYLKWIWPRQKKLIAAAKAIKPDVIVFYHSCGYIKPFIPYLIEAGVDVLNPVQPECMDFAEIFEKFGDKLSFHGTIGTQSTMPFGSAEDVKKAVKRNLDIAGPKGGLFVAPTHLLEPEVPWENIEAYASACREYKK